LENLDKIRLGLLSVGIPRQTLQRLAAELNATRAETAVRDEMSSIEENAYTEALGNGMEIYDPTSDQIEAWQKASQPVIETWLKEAGALGQQVYDAAKDL